VRGNRWKTVKTKEKENPPSLKLWWTKKGERKMFKVQGSMNLELGT